MLATFVLGSRTNYGSLDIGDYRDNSINLTLPDGISGNYYLFAKTDSNDDVFELDNDNNIAFDTITIDSKPADLAVSEVIIPSIIEAGTGTLISWTVTNQGTGDTVKTSWNDQLVLSLDSVVGNSDDRLLKTFTHNGLLNAGSSYTNNELVTIPFNLQGNYQLYIKTDVNNSVYEADREANNTSVFSPIAITRETPDLLVTTVNAPVAGQSGESITVNWSVANSGTGKTNSNYWYDEVFLSTDRDSGDSSDISLGKVYHSGSLNTGETYDVSRTFNLPQNINGDYYVVVRTDIGNQVLETPLENNNELATSSKTSISLNAVPDLVIEQIDAPNQAISGQTFDVSWTVSNQGTNVNNSWRDVFYLSRDQVFDRSSDIYLGSSFHYGNLAAGGEYSQTASFNIPRGLSGPFYVFGVTDSSNSIYERDGENNNIAYDGNSTNVILPPPADLVAGTISVPANGVPGENITLNYTVTNQGDHTLSGNWEDAVYLSEDNRWDINDLLIEKVQVDDSLDIGESYSKTVNASLPGVKSGDYHVIVRSDIRNNVYESDEDNNLQVSAEQINIDTELLELGSSDTDTISPGKSIYYRLEVSAGQAIRIKLDSQADNSSNNVYVRHEQMPTKGQFDFFTEPFSADPELVFPVEQDGTYYVLVTGDGSSVASNYTITAEEIPFSLLDVTTKKVGNVAPFTLELEGAKFDADNTIFQIVDEEGTVFEATQIVLKDSTSAYATFDLSGQSIGNYDVRAIQNNETIEILEDVLIVEDGVDAELFSSIDGPGLVRPGGKYFAKLNYVNAGGADEAAPLIILQTPDTSLGLSSDSIAPTESLFLLGVGEDLGVDTLRAGEINQIPFFFSAGRSVNVNMLRYTEDSSTLITEADWNMIEAAIKPAEIAEGDWDEFWSSIQPRIGNTWGDYVRVVNDIAKAFSSEAERDYDVRELFAQWYESGDLSVYTPKSSVSVQLIDRQTDLPVSGVPVRFFEYVDEQTVKSFYQAVTDEQGRFQVASVPSGTYKVVLAGGYSFTEELASTSSIDSNNLVYDLEFP
ncbi:MAG: hypothetical protein HC930_02690, partial [Hydrococcus sp. SU_1_0]|nr:hypothetical protein [Hydrococcus sp. SU_1_0]